MRAEIKSRIQQSAVAERFRSVTHNLRGKAEFAIHKSLGEFAIRHAKPLTLNEVLDERGDKLNNLGLYVHVPFCTKICSFCAFERRTGGETRQDPFVNSLETHIDQTLSKLKPGLKVPTVFYGGGTPSLLGIEQVQRIQSKISEHVDISEADITFELHPENITREYIEGLQAAGITRFSVGVQSLSTSERKVMRRDLTSVEDDLAKLRLLNEMGVEYNVDLLFGTSDQSPESWRETVMGIVNEIHPPQITTYQYANAYGAASRQQFEQGTAIRPDLGQTHRMYLGAQRYLTSHGYRQSSTLTYERADRPPRTYSILREGSDNLGLGPKTYSKIGPWAFINTGNTTDFLRGDEASEYFGVKLPVLVEKGMDAFSLVSRPSHSDRGDSHIPLGEWKSEVISQVYGVLYYILNQKRYPGSKRDERTIVNLGTRPQE